MRGLQVYRLTLGEQVRKKELVNIFDFDDFTVLCAVEKQERFYQKWIDCIVGFGKK